MTLVINTRSTHGVRRIPGASALPDAAERGYAAETATRSAAVEWGLPDFVYESANERVGRGTRELGDGIVIVGELGVVLQVKSRDAVSVQMEKESRWLEKQTARALAQGAGTVRRLKLAPVPLTNLRGRTIEVDGNAHRWLLVVIVDHDQPPSGIEPSLSEKHPSIVLLRRDWEFLFDQLKSTHAVCQYCERVADEPLELGTEPLRYYELAQADAEAKPSNLAGPGDRISAPLLPMAPAGSEDLEAHLLVREVLEAVASPRSLVASELDRLRVLAQLDRLQVGHRANIGRFLLASMDELLNESSPDSVWRMRSLRGGVGEAHLGYAVCSRPHNPQLADVFGWWVRLRHHDALAVRRDVDTLTTVGVLLTPRADNDSWDTTMAAISGDPEFTAEELAELRKLWPSELLSAD